MAKNKNSLKTKTKLPESFRRLLWSYRFPLIDIDEDKQRIIINAVNYGDWEHWRWLVNYYGLAEVKRIIENTPVSEFRPRVLRLICLLFKIKKMKYATRSTKIRATKNI